VNFGIRHLPPRNLNEEEDGSFTTWFYLVPGLVGQALYIVRVGALALRPIYGFTAGVRPTWYRALRLTTPFFL
jgi:hypothetical protein